MVVRLPISSSISVEFSGLVSLRKAVSSTAQRNDLLNQWADDYFQFAHARHSLLASGGSAGSNQNWRRLSEATKAKRRQRLKSKSGVKPKDVNSILQDTLQLFGATRKKGGPGQVRKLDTANFRVALGIGGPTQYKDPVSPKRKRKRTLGQLAAFHAATGRPIIVQPNTNTLQKMEQAALVWVLKRKKESS